MGLMGVMESQLTSESIHFTYIIHFFQIDQYSENYKKTKHSIYNIHSTSFVQLYLINNYMITAKIILLKLLIYSYNFHQAGCYY